MAEEDEHRKLVRFSAREMDAWKQSLGIRTGTEKREEPQVYAFADTGRRTAEDGFIFFETPSVKRFDEPLGILGKESKAMGVEHHGMYTRTPEEFQRAMRLPVSAKSGMFEQNLLPDVLMSNVESETRSRIKQCIGNAYHSDEHSDDVLQKIRETIIDLAVLAKSHRIGMSDFYDFMTPVRILNEAVYYIDNSLDNHEINNGNMNGLFSFRSKMFFAASKFLSDVGRGDLVNMPAQLFHTIEANYLRETAGTSPEPWVIEYTSTFFKKFLEPSDHEYIDIGFYGYLFTGWFKKQLEERARLQLLWNARCRTTDVIDGLIDLEEDVDRKVFSPLVLYIFDRSNFDEKEIIKNSVLSRKTKPQFQEIVQKYSSHLLGSIKDYVDGISPRRRKTLDFKDRTYKIIGLGLDIVQKPEATKEYERFYSQPI
jgi:hypothetical protein